GTERQQGGPVVRILDHAVNVFDGAGHPAAGAQQNLTGVAIVLPAPQGLEVPAVESWIIHGGAPGRCIMAPSYHIPLSRTYFLFGRGICHWQHCPPGWFWASRLRARARGFFNRPSDIPSFICRRRQHCPPD